MTMQPDLARLMAARDRAAEIVIADACYAPIFERLDDEVRAAEARKAEDPVARARALIAEARA